MSSNHDSESHLSLLDWRVAPPAPTAIEPRYTWLVSADESGIGGQKYYGFGSLWMPWQRRGTFHGEFMAIRKKHRMPDEWEMKWSNLGGEVRRRTAMELIDWFFRRPWLMFHCVVVRVADVDRGCHGGNMDLARRKHFAMLLTRKMQQCAKAHADRANAFRLWVDPIASSYKKAGEATQIIAEHTLRQKLKQQAATIEHLQERDSKLTPSIQLCDLLLGAVMDAWQGQARKSEKLTVAAEIARHLGWSDLAADTYPAERKFNIWYFYDGKRERTIKTRPVKLLHRLPKRR